MLNDYLYDNMNMVMVMNMMVRVIQKGGSTKEESDKTGEPFKHPRIEKVSRCHDDDGNESYETELSNEDV